MRVILILNLLILDLKLIQSWHTTLAISIFYTCGLIEGNLQNFNFDVSENPQNLPSFWPPSRERKVLLT